MQSSDNNHKHIEHISVIKSFRDALVKYLLRAEEWLFAHPKTILLGILIATSIFAIGVPILKVYSNFSDLLPQKDPYIKVYNEIKNVFGGANNFVIGIEVKQGTIFSDKTLKVLNEATLKVDDLPGVDHNRVESLTHRSIRRVYIDEDGGLVSKPYYNSLKDEQLNANELNRLRSEVVIDPNVYGQLVSPDLKAAVIKAQLNDNFNDYEKFFSELQDMRKSLAQPGIRIYATGYPVLTGWVSSYVSQIIEILAWTLLLIAIMLTVYFRRLYGVALPLIGIGLSSIWGLGFMSFMGINLEPLSLPIPFLIAARATSHGVQLVNRYYEELAITNSAKRSARNALEALFRPGSLAITVDALGILAIVLGTAPFDVKLGIAAAFWSFSVIFTVHFMVPLALTVLPQPRTTKNSNEQIRRVLAAVMSKIGGHDAGAIGVLVTALIVVVGGFYFVYHVKIGDSESGSPLLFRNHDYNISSAAINDLFPGSDDLVVLAKTKKKGGINDPKTLAGIEHFQNYVQAHDSDVGGVKSIPGLYRVVNWIIHNNDPRWLQLPESAGYIGGLAFMYIASSPVTNPLNSYINSPGQNMASVVFYFKNHKTETVNKAIKAALSGIKEVQSEFPALSLSIGGGSIGIAAAVNRALVKDQFIVIPVALFAAFMLVSLYYRSAHAGWLMILPMMFSVVMTFAFMGLRHINISVATVPVIAVGVGVGIDYAVYFMDRIREEMSLRGDIYQSVVAAFSTTGYAVSFTAATLVAGVVMWIFMAQLKFQVDIAVLLSFILVINAIAAMLIVPSWCVVFKPHFVMKSHRENRLIMEDSE